MNGTTLKPDYRRVDAALKVTGRARYGSDFDGGAHPTHACLVTSTIARGHIATLDDTALRALPGVLEVLSYKNLAGRIKPGQTFLSGGYMNSTIAPLDSPEIWHAGQVIAVVIAESFEQARAAARELKVTYIEEPPRATFSSEEPVGATATSSSGSAQTEPGPSVGDALTVHAAAPVRIDARYATPTQHHNSMELFTTTCAWKHDQLTVWESSQNVYGYQHGLAAQLGIAPSKIRIISPYLGGAFGSRSFLNQTTALIAWGAKMLDRPVKLEASRAQGFTIGTYRAETRHRLRLAASREGQLQALIHDGWEISSQHPRVCMPQCCIQCDRGPRRSRHAGLHACARGSALPFRLGVGDGRAGCRLEHGSDRAATKERHLDRAHRGAALHVACFDAMLRCGGRTLSLVTARSSGRIHGHSGLAHRLWMRLERLPDRHGAGGRACHP
jgi:CO/xanthine dehydrogenase Mo-binding subunit